MPRLTVVPIPSSGTLEVVGESYYQDGIAAMQAPGEAVTALLVPEVGNPYDANAVQVLLTNGARAEKAGYLDREVARQWRPTLDQLARQGQVAGGVARFVGGQSEKPTIGVWVDVDAPPIERPLDVDTRYAADAGGPAVPQVQAGPHGGVQYVVPITNGTATAALVLGILGFILMGVPLIGIFLGGPLDIAALILGIVGLNNAAAKYRVGIAASVAAIVLASVSLMSVFIGAGTIW